MTELIVGGIDGTHYIIEVNGAKRTVQKGDSVLFNKKEDAQNALKNVKLIGGELLFHEKLQPDNEAKEIKDSSVTVAMPRDEADSGILDTGNKIIDSKMVEKRELKVNAKNNKNG